MSTFTLQSGEIYSLPFDFSPYLSAGEILKTFTVNLDGTDLIAPSGIVMSYEKYDTETVLVKVQGISDSSIVTVNLVTSRNASKTRSISVTVDPNDDPATYNDMSYRFLVEDNSKDIFIVFKSDSGLEYNNEYSVNISSGLTGKTDPIMSATSFWFTSQYCPLFTTINKIRLLGGPYISVFTDDTIYRYILKNSLEVIDILTPNKLPFDYFGCDGTNMSKLAIRYVECKTAFDLISLLDQINRVGTSQSKQLGDMAIKYGAMNLINKNLSPKKNLYDCFMGAMNAISGNQSAVRGINDVSLGYLHPAKYFDNRVIKYNPCRNTPGTHPWRTI